MVFVAPLILVASAMLGYWLAGRSLRPVEVMIDELDAIQDGTSLNRRLAVPLGEDELVAPRAEAQRHARAASS